MEEKCPECGNKKLIRDYERGELICANCGLIVAENIVDAGPEWRAFDDEQKEKRVRGGAPIKYMRANKGLATEIDQYNRDIRGAKISSKKQAQLHRMRKWHKRVSISGSKERNLVVALAELDRIASYLGLSENIRESAALMYRKCIEKGLIKGRLIESVVSAVLYAVCRNYGVPRTLDEIAEVSGVEKKEIGRAFRYISHGMKLQTPIANPIHFVPRFTAALKLGGEVQEKAIKLIKNAIAKGLVSGKTPIGIAAAAVYIACAMVGEKRTQKEVADVANVTEVTIRNIHWDLKNGLKLKLAL